MQSHMTLSIVFHTKTNTKMVYISFTKLSNITGF